MMKFQFLEGCKIDTIDCLVEQISNLAIVPFTHFSLPFNKNLSMNSCTTGHWLSGSWQWP